MPLLEFWGFILVILPIQIFPTCNVKYQTAVLRSKKAVMCLVKEMSVSDKLQLGMSYGSIHASGSVVNEHPLKT